MIVRLTGVVLFTQIMPFSIIMFEIEQWVVRQAGGGASLLTSDAASMAIAAVGVSSSMTSFGYVLVTSHGVATAVCLSPALSLLVLA